MFSSTLLPYLSMLLPKEAFDIFILLSFRVLLLLFKLVSKLGSSEGSAFFLDFDRTVMGKGFSFIMSSSTTIYPLELMALLCVNLL